MTRMAIVGTMALGVGVLVALFDAKCAHGETEIQYQTDALGRQVASQTTFPARVSQAGRLSQAQAEPNISEAKAQFGIDGLGRRVPNRTNSPWMGRVRRVLSTVTGVIEPKAEAEPSGIRYHTDALGRKVSGRTISPLG